MKPVRIGKTLVTLVVGLFWAAPLWAESVYRQHQQVAYATVLSAQPIEQSFVERVPREECWSEPVVETERHRSSATGTILGGIIGAAVGNRLGHNKSNKRVGAVAGALLGASIGNDISSRHHRASRHYREQTQCRTVYDEIEQSRTVGYRVKYRYNGQTYTTQTRHHPGDTLKLQLTFAPVEE